MMTELQKINNEIKIIQQAMKIIFDDNVDRNNIIDISEMVFDEPKQARGRM
jgi:hypothetical protein